MCVTKFVHSFMTSLIVLYQKKLSAFRNFNHLNANCQLDVFLYKEMGQQSEYRLLWGVVQELLLLMDKRRWKEDFLWKDKWKDIT